MDENKINDALYYPHENYPHEKTQYVDPDYHSAMFEEGTKSIKELDILDGILKELEKVNGRLDKLEAGKQKIDIRKWAVEQEIEFYKNQSRTNPTSNSLTYSKFAAAKRMADFILNGKIEK